MFEGDTPVQRHNHGTTDVPSGIDEKYARGDYWAVFEGGSGRVGVAILEHKDNRDE